MIGNKYLLCKLFRGGELTKGARYRIFHIYSDKLLKGHCIECGFDLLSIYPSGKSVYCICSDCEVKLKWLITYPSIISNIYTCNLDPDC